MRPPRQSSKPVMTVALAGLTVAFCLRGCAPLVQSNARLLEYHLLKDERTIDPQSGDTIMTSTWQYEGGGGYTTTTTKRIPRGARQSDWDRPPRPAPVVVD
jgi:hypothetical protein